MTGSVFAAKRHEKNTGALTLCRCIVLFLQKTDGRYRTVICFDASSSTIFLFLGVSTWIPAILSRNPAQSSGPPANVAGGGRRLHLDVSSLKPSVTGAAKSVCPLEFAVGSFNAVPTAHTELILGCAGKFAPFLNDHMLNANFKRAMLQNIPFRETLRFEQAGLAVSS